jgi:hypothetical protein
MREDLLPLNLYSLAEDTYVDKELRSYVIGLDALGAGLELIAAECFVQTALTYGIELRERLCGGTMPALTLDQRRERLYLLFSAQVEKATLIGITSAFRAYGISGTVCEDFDNERLILGDFTYSGDPADLAAVMHTARKWLPVHLGFTVESANAPTWNQRDSFNYSFDQWDSFELPFELFNNEE